MKDVEDRGWQLPAARTGTRQQHACLLAARAALPPGYNDADLAAEYRRLRSLDAYAELNALELSAGHLAELAMVVQGGPAGVGAHRLDARVRATLSRHALTVPAQGCEWAADDWRAQVRPTVAGVAVLVAAQGRKVTLNSSEAAPLAVIERAMHNEELPGSSTWPGSALALRVALTWRLVEHVRLPRRRGSAHWSSSTPPTVYRLTLEGLAALERSRTGPAPSGAEVTPATADVLTRVSRATRGDLGVTDARTTRAVQKCLDLKWLVEGGRVPGTTRRGLKLTEGGRDALEAWRFHRQAKTEPAPPTFSVAQLKVGWRVRASNRRTFEGVGTEWVTVAEVKGSPYHTQGRMAHNYEVWVVRDGDPVPFLYAGRALFRSVRFQLFPSEA